MVSNRRRAGMTLIEIAVVVAIAGVLAALSVPLLGQVRGAMRTKAAARSLSNLLTIARSEAIRTQVNHAVFFWVDALGNPLLDASGNRAAAAVIADANTNGLIDAGEIVATVTADPTLAWGVSLAAGAGPPPTDPDPNASFTTGWTLRDPNGIPAQWVVFQPDGIPRGFRVAPYDDGGAAGIGTGGGGVYLTNGSRDYAAVLFPLGGTRVHAFDSSRNAWSQ